MGKHTGRFSITIAFFSIVFILYKTLFPFNFLFAETFSKSDHLFLILKLGKFYARDTTLNILLFLPLGISLTSYLIQKKKMKNLSAFGLVLLVSCGLSYSIEILQFFQPSRYPSMNDVIANSTGGILGYIFCRWKRLSLSGFFALAFITSIFLQMETSLSNWNKTFPLLLGNELTEDRPWEGYISKVYITDRALSNDELEDAFSETFPADSINGSLLASYQFSDKRDFNDKTGRFPSLIWMGKPGDVQEGKGIFLGPHHWLKSTSHAEYLTQRIIETSQFSLGVTVATDKTMQTGPARIVSLSADPRHRNFTLGQEESNLIFRLRTPLTGDNGTPDMIVRDLFTSPDRRNIIISYNGSVLKVYVDGIKTFHKFELSPGAVAFSYLYAINNLYPINISLLSVYKIIWYAIIFIPLGILVSLINKIMNKHIILISGVILLPSFILEGILVSVSGRDVILENLFICILFTIIPVLLFKFARDPFALRRSV